MKTPTQQGVNGFLTSEKRVKTKANSMLQQGEFNVAVEFTDIRARNESWKWK